MADTRHYKFGYWQCDFRPGLVEDKYLQVSVRKTFGDLTEDLAGGGVLWYINPPSGTRAAQRLPWLKETHFCELRGAPPLLSVRVVKSIQCRTVRSDI